MSGRRAKIAMTVVSLVLTIMTLSYGVYAALTTKYKLESSINFTSVDVLVEITQIDVYQASMVSSTLKRGDKISSKTVTYEGGFSEYGGQTDVTVTLDNLSFNDGDTIMPYLIFEVYYTNHGENAMNITLNKSVSTLPENVEYNDGTSTTATTMSGTTVGNNLATTAPGTATTNANNRAFIIVLKLVNDRISISGTVGLKVDFTKQQ